MKYRVKGEKKKKCAADWIIYATDITGQIRIKLKFHDKY